MASPLVFTALSCHDAPRLQLLAPVSGVWALILDF